MSIKIMTAVWNLDLPDSEKLALLALADCANDEGLCWPSMATPWMAARLNLQRFHKRIGHNRAD